MNNPSVFTVEPSEVCNLSPLRPEELTKGECKTNTGPTKADVLYKQEKQSDHYLIILIGILTTDSSEK